MGEYEMNDNDFEPYREAFDRAAWILGWTKHKRMDHHERDGFCDPQESVYWKSDNDEYLIDEDEMTEGFVKEIIRLSELILSRQKQ